MRCLPRRVEVGIRFRGGGDRRVHGRLLVPKPRCERFRVVVSRARSEAGKTGAGAACQMRETPVGRITICW